MNKHHLGAHGLKQRLKHKNTNEALQNALLVLGLNAHLLLPVERTTMCRMVPLPTSHGMENPPIYVIEFFINQVFG